MHVLIIGWDGPLSEAAIDLLWAAGYHSIVRIDDSEEAKAVLATCHADLILALRDVTQQTSTAELRRISQIANAPIICAHRGADLALSCLGPQADNRATEAREHISLAA